jgi:hypothetical protein
VADGEGSAPLGAETLVGAADAGASRRVGEGAGVGAAVVVVVGCVGATRGGVAG